MEAAFEAAAADSDQRTQGLQSPCAEKKPSLFMGVLSCMSSVLGVFGKADLINDYGKSKNLVNV